MSHQGTSNAKRKRPAHDLGNEHSQPRVLRGEIAYRAARLIAEDGITSFAAAKQKAARQMGITEQGLLPGNHEIDDALRAYQSIFQGNTQPQECRVLRQISVDVMRWLDRFSPWLVGTVLSGTANSFSQIELEIVGDDEAKHLEMFFFNEGVPFETRVERAVQTQRTDTLNDIVIYEISFHECQIDITFYPNQAMRTAHHSCESLKHARAKLVDIERLFASQR